MNVIIPSISLDFKMVRPFTLTLNGSEPILNTNFFPPIELNGGEYECALIDFHMYNSIPNVDDSNNLFHIGNKIIEIPIGSYELEDIYDYLKTQLLPDGLDNTFKIESNNNTLKVHITTSTHPIYFDKKRSIGNLFGFNKRVLQADKKITYVSDQPVNIFKINTIRLVCNIVSGSYIDSGQDHTLYEFGINVPPGYKMSVTPNNLIYLPVNTREIRTLSMHITDQNGDLINLRGEKFTIRMHLRLIQ